MSDALDFFRDLKDPDAVQKHIRQGSEQWDQIRCGRFTSSEMHKLLAPTKREMTEAELKARPKSGVGSSVKYVYSDDGLSDTAMTYIYQKVAETLTGTIKNAPYAQALGYGIELEAEAVEWFEKIKGFRCEEIGFCVYTDHAGGSPDRDIPEQDAILEIKCPFFSEHQINYLLLTDHYDLKRMNPEYYWQMQSNMLFANRKKGWFATFDPRFKDDKLKMNPIEIPAVEKDQDLILKKIPLAVKEKLALIQTLSK